MIFIFTTVWRLLLQAGDQSRGYNGIGHGGWVRWGGGGDRSLFHACVTGLFVSGQNHVTSVVYVDTT